MKVIFRLNAVWMLLVATMLSGCQNSRFAIISPATGSYRPHKDLQTSVPIVAPPPIITAALPTEIVKEETEVNHVSQALTSHILVPDTIVKTPERPVLSGKSDPTTTVVNSIGGVIAAVGIGVIIANSGEAPKTEWGGLSQLILFLGGLVMALLGLGLLFFQGKNGRLRRLREARKAAALPPASTSGQTVAPESANPDTRAGQKQRAGFHLMVVGGVIGLLGFLVSGYLLLLLPIAVIMLLVGGVMSIVGM